MSKITIPFVPPPRSFGCQNIFKNLLWIHQIIPKDITYHDLVLCALNKLYPTSYEEYLAISDAKHRREIILNYRLRRGRIGGIDTNGRDEDDDELFLDTNDSIENENVQVLQGWEREKNTEQKQSLAADVTDVSTEMVSVSMLETRENEKEIKEMEKYIQDEKDEIEDCKDLASIAFAIREKGLLRINAIRSIANEGISDTVFKVQRVVSTLVTIINQFSLASFVEEELINHKTYFSRDYQVWKATEAAFGSRRDDEEDDKRYDNQQYKTEGNKKQDSSSLYWRYSPLGAKFQEHVSHYFRIRGKTACELDLRIRNVANYGFTEEIELLYALGHHLSNQQRSASLNLLAVETDKNVVTNIRKKVLNTSSKSIHTVTKDNDKATRNSVSYRENGDTFSINTRIERTLNLICSFCEVPIRGIAVSCRNNCGRFFHKYHEGEEGGEGEHTMEECVVCKLERK
jgi:hypothetical protein